MERKRLPWEPEWEGPIKGWTINFIKRNYWRVASHYEFEDLLQEAYIKYLQICNAYPNVMQPAHFMRLYQVALRNHMHDLANAVTREVTELVDPEVLGQVPAANGHYGFINTLVRQAPEEVKLFLEKLADDDGAIEMRQPRQYTLGYWLSYIRETNNEFYCRILGLDPKEVKLTTMIRDHFS